MRFVLVFCIFSFLWPQMGAAGPMHDAARAGDIAALEALIAEGANINAKDPLVGSPLHMAALSGQQDAAAFLLANGANVNRKGGMLGLTPLQVAVGSGAAMVKLLLENGAKVGAKDLDGNTALHLAADTGDVEVIGVLLDAGLGPDLPNNRNILPIEIAGAAGHFEAVDYFRARGALPLVDYPPIENFMANADSARGRELFRDFGCGHCHENEQNREEGLLNLRGIIGATVGSSPNFDHSEALLRTGGVWTLDRLNAWLAEPKRFAPGNLMNRAPQPISGSQGVAEPQNRADILAYLQAPDAPE